MPLNFQVNKQNLILSKLNYNDEILIYGGTMVDVKELFQSTQKLLQQEVEKVNLYKLQVEEKDNELKRKNSEIVGLNNEISYSKNILNSMSDTILMLKMSTENWRKELKNKQEDYLTLERNFELLNTHKRIQETKIQEKEKKLSELDKLIKQREKIIQNQSTDIQMKEALLKIKNRNLIISLTIGALAILTGIFLLWSIKTKQKYNKLLEQKVEDRTRELQRSERNYREIFNGVSEYIFIHDDQGKIIDVNDPMLEAFGYSKEEILLMDIGKLSDEEKGYTNEKAAEMFEIAKKPDNMFLIGKLNGK
ncbi:MAG: PAS domain S-box protein [Bacteroidales bacterium]|nr:PAS domain S-box protein [Bacteroidales bacterium]